MILSYDENIKCCVELDVVKFLYGFWYEEYVTLDSILLEHVLGENSCNFELDYDYPDDVAINNINDNDRDELYGCHDRQDNGTDKLKEKNSKLNYDDW